MHRSSTLLCIVLVAGCEVSCPSGSAAHEGRCISSEPDGAVVDAGRRDAGADAGDEDAQVADGGQDAGPCGMECAAPTPVCDETMGACVECVGPSDCGGATPVCVLGACEECEGNAECTDPSSSRCEASACAPCAGDADCTHLAGLGVCDGGTCVECTAGDESACGADVCDVAGRACSDRPAGSGASCGRVVMGAMSIARECLSDRECPTGHACVHTRFDEPPEEGTLLDIGHFCLPLAGATCTMDTRPYVDRQMLPNRAGDLVAVCALRVTSCPAYVAFGSTECTTDENCGAPGIDDGVCRPGSPETGGLACTTRCGGAIDCDTGFGCSSATPRFCCFGPSC